MKKVLIVGTSLGTAHLLYVNIRGRQQCEKNICNLTVMNNDGPYMKPPATAEEMLFVEQELNEQLAYQRIIIKTGLPPRVHWAFLPMDEEYAKGFKY